MRFNHLRQFILAASLMGWGALAQPTPATFDEVSSLIRSNLAGTSPKQLDQLAVAGLLQEIAPRVALVDDPNDPLRADLPAGVVNTQLYRGSIGYVRLGHIVEGTDEQLRSRYRDLVTSNRLSGFVLDLRMATGDDYDAALRVADQFLMDEVPLLNWGQGLKRSRDKEDAITLPIAVLVNSKTGGGAEAVAAMLRKSGVALLIGGITAGTAGIQQTFPLSNGQFLKITVANIQLGDAQLLAAGGVVPDVTVAVRPALEEALLNGTEDPADSETGAAGLGTNNFSNRLRMNEADLVRRWKGEMMSMEDFQGPRPETGPEARDPSLLRALDLMDGLAILRSWQK
jgi:hypothetical protein